MLVSPGLRRELPDGSRFICACEPPSMRRHRIAAACPTGPEDAEKIVLWQKWARRGPFVVCDADLFGEACLLTLVLTQLTWRFVVAATWVDNLGQTSGPFRGCFCQIGIGIAQKGPIDAVSASSYVVRTGV